MHRQCDRAGIAYAKNSAGPQGTLERDETNELRVPQAPPRPREGSADPRVAREPTQVGPAEGSFGQQESNPSICGSDTGASNRSSGGKPRVAKVFRKQHPEHI